MTNEERVEAIRAGRMQPLDLWLKLYPFIRKVAGRYVDKKTDLEDLVQESFFGFMRALELFDPGKDIKFTTYCGFWIKQSVLHYKETAGGLVRVPANSVVKVWQYKRFVAGFAAEIGRDPTDYEVKAAIGVDRETLEHDALILSVASLDKELGEEGDGGSLLNLLPDETDVESEVLDRVQAEELSVKLWECVDTLQKRQREVIRGRYKDNKTLDECGEALGISRERVRQIEAAALRKMRTGKIRKELEPFLDDIRYSLGVRKGKDPTGQAVVEMDDYLAKLKKDGLI